MGRTSTLALALSLSLGGCAAHVSAYRVSPEVNIRMEPMGPFVCTDGFTDGKPSRHVDLFITLIDMAPQDITVAVNHHPLVAWYRHREAQFRYPAGVGRHRIDITVGERVYDRSLVVSECKEGL